MSATKKGFLKAGAILGIVFSSIMALFGIIMFSSMDIVTEDMVKNSYSIEQNYTLYEDVDGSYTIEYTDEEGQTIVVSQEEVQLVVKVSKIVLLVIGLIIVGYSVAVMAVSILILKKVNKEVNPKGLTITLLVLSALMSSVLIVSFMIVALCLKDKKPTLENIDEFIIE